MIQTDSLTLSISSLNNYSTHTSYTVRNVIYKQRTCYRKEKLSPDRITRLESIGFVWDLKYRVDENWMEMYNKLLRYKQEHKDCNVPRKYNKDLKLGIWVKNKRFYYNFNNTGRYKLSTKQLHLLNEINFFDSPFVCI